MRSFRCSFAVFQNNRFVSPLVLTGACHLYLREPVICTYGSLLFTLVEEYSPHTRSLSAPRKRHKTTLRPAATVVLLLSSAGIPPETAFTNVKTICLGFIVGGRGWRHARTHNPQERTNRSTTWKNQGNTIVSLQLQLVSSVLLHLCSRSRRAVGGALPHPASYRSDQTQQGVHVDRNDECCHATPKAKTAQGLL